MIALFAELPSSSYVCVTKSAKRPIERRAIVLDALVAQLVEGGLDRLVLGHIDPDQQRLDRQVLARVLRGTGVAYSHEVANTSEPMLWVPDAIACCAGHPSRRL